MKRTQVFRVIALWVVPCLALAIASLRSAPASAQSTTENDDGYYTIYTTIDADSNNVISVYTDGPDADFDDDEEYILEGVLWDLSCDCGYYDSGGGAELSERYKKPQPWSHTRLDYDRHTHSRLRARKLHAPTGYGISPPELVWRIAIGKPSVEGRLQLHSNRPGLLQLNGAATCRSRRRPFNRATVLLHNGRRIFATALCHQSASFAH